MKLLAAGCSFSDYLPNNNIVWGEVLAQKLGAEYMHEGAGCGSNYRIWRVVTRYVIDGTITPNDLVCIQYTGIDRREFWTKFPRKNPIRGPKQVELREDWHGEDKGHLLRFKQDAGRWQDYPEENTFFTMLEENFICNSFSLEQFKTNHHMFQSLLEVYKIPTVFMLVRNIFPEYVEASPYHKKLLFREDYSTAKKKTNWYQGTDYTHLSDGGHINMAEQMYTHLKKVGYLT